MKKKILMVTPELAKFAMVGGIAEYILGLASALVYKGYDVRVVLPHYGFLQPTELKNMVCEVPRLPVALGPGASSVTAVYRMNLPLAGPEQAELPVYMLGGHQHFACAISESHVYQWPNHEPWIVFNKAVIEWLKLGHWVPDILHCHDAHAAMIPVFIQQIRSKEPALPLASVRTIQTVHNLLYQGKGDQALVAYAGLNPEWFNPDGLEFYGYTNCMKAGILCADQVNAVSPSYAHEICESSHFGFGLEGVLAHVRSRGQLRGIVNGIDETRWRLEGIHYTGTQEDIEILEAIKDTSRREQFIRWHWEIDDQPILMFRARWDNQKGVYLLASCLQQILGMARCLVVTWGGPGLSPELQWAWKHLHELVQQFPQQLLLNPEGLTSPQATSLHYTLSDFVLMPSVYEPCGLVQLEAQRYGVIPIVRHTGGLIDTISETTDALFPSPNGFVFHEMEPKYLLAAVRRAVDCFAEREVFRNICKHTLLQRNSWNVRVSGYEQMYQVS